MKISHTLHSTPPTPAHIKKSHLFLFHGNDTFTVSEKINFWIEEFKKKYDRTPTIIDAQILSGEQLFNNIRDALQGYTLFDPVRLIVIRHVFSMKRVDAERIHSCILEHLEHIPETHFIVFHEETIDKRIALYKKCADLKKKHIFIVEEFSIPTGDALETWIETRLVLKKISMEGHVLKKFIARFTIPEYVSTYSEKPSYTLWHIHNELEKLLSYTGGAPITEQAIEELTRETTPSHVFEYTESLLSRNVPAAYRNSHALLPRNTTQAKSELLGIIAFLQNQFRDFLTVKTFSEKGMSSSAIADILTWNPKRLWIVQRNIHTWSLNSLREVYKDITEVERLAKSSSLPAPILLHRITLKCIQS